MTSLFQVSSSEFVHHEASRLEDKDDKEIDKLRRMEFRGAMDKNDDRFLDLDEIREYLNPRGKHFVMNEARHMMAEADADQNKMLSLQEIKDNYLHFQNHKDNPVIRAIHDEFWEDQISNLSLYSLVGCCVTNVL